jgi:hypothetical protein
VRIHYRQGERPEAEPLAGGTVCEIKRGKFPQLVDQPHPAATDSEDGAGQAGLPEFGPRLGRIGGDPKVAE